MSTENVVNIPESKSNSI